MKAKKEVEMQFCDSDEDFKEARGTLMLKKEQS
jgi:hypothetical protein